MPLCLSFSRLGYHDQAAESGHLLSPPPPRPPSRARGWGSPQGCEEEAKAAGGAGGQPRSRQAGQLPSPLLQLPEQIGFEKLHEWNINASAEPRAGAAEGIRTRVLWPGRRWSAARTPTPTCRVAAPSPRTARPRDPAAGPSKFPQRWGPRGQRLGRPSALATLTAAPRGASWTGLHAQLLAGAPTWQQAPADSPAPPAP